MTALKGSKFWRLTWLGLFCVLVAASLLVSPVFSQEAQADVVNDVVVWGQGSSFGGSGCTATSDAMICNYFGSGMDLAATFQYFLDNGLVASDGTMNQPGIRPGHPPGTAKCEGSTGSVVLQTVRDLLQAGYLIEGWDSNPFHHWVIVGFQGSTFYLNDPAANSHNGARVASTTGAPSGYSFDGYWKFSGTHTVPPPVPTISGLNPTSTDTYGGAPITITGSGFSGATAVTFGGAGAIFTVNSASQITATAPAHAAGAVRVQVTTPGGSTADTSADNFTYYSLLPSITGLSPTSGSTAGGTSVVISGAFDQGVMGVTFGGIDAASYTVDSASRITAISPAHAAGTVQVQVTGVYGSSADTSADNFTYVSPVPTITSLSVTQGSTAGGTSLLIAGQNLSGVTAVTFGGIPATDVHSVVTNIIGCTTPAHPAGTVQVQVTTGYGSSANTAADDFTYIFPVPTVTSISRTVGSTAGGFKVVITGTNFNGNGASPYFGDTSCSFHQDSSTQFTVTAPAHAAGSVHLRVGVLDDARSIVWSPETSADYFTFVAPNSKDLSVGWNAIAGDSGSDTGGLTLFGFDGSGYVSVQGASAVAGQGYWCKAPSSTSVSLGVSSSPLSVDLRAGWNLVGNSTKTTVSVPGGLVAFTYHDGGYTSSNTLAPGEGAWVKSAAAQTTVLTTVANPAYFGKILTDTSSNASYLITGGGKRAYIPSGGDYQAIVNAGVSVVATDWSVITQYPDAGYQAAVSRDDNPVISGPTNWLVTRGSGGWNNSSYVITGSAAGKYGYDTNWGIWTLSNGRGLVRVRCYVPAADSTATVVYHVFDGDQEIGQRSFRQGDVRGQYVELGTWQFYSGTIKVRLGDNEGGAYDEWIAFDMCEAIPIG